jgi:hypothetical protein
MSTCVSNKRIYLTQSIAEDVLIELWAKYDYAANQGPCAVYKCDDCGYYHLTSTGEMNSRLAEQLANGTLKRRKEANRWTDRFKNK